MPKALRQSASAEYNSRETVKYADALIVLLEDVAKIIDTHHPLVETYYGMNFLPYSTCEHGLK